MSVKVNVQRNDLEYEKGCVVKHKSDGWYGILVVTDVAKGTYNVLKFDEKNREYVYLYYTINTVTLSDIQYQFSVITDNKGYDLTLTLKGDN